MADVASDEKLRNVMGDISKIEGEEGDFYGRI